ncbi:hypothetical protein ACTFIV_007789 [Dictyostelium citrinum]
MTKKTTTTTLTKKRPLKEVTTTKKPTTTLSKKKPLKEVVATKKPIKVVEKVVVEEEKPAWNDEDEDEDEEKLNNSVVEEEKEKVIEDEDEEQKEDENEEEKEEENEKEEEKDNQENKDEEQTDEKIVKKAKVSNESVWADEEDVGIFKNRSLLKVTPEWAKIKEKGEDDKEEENIFNSNKNLVNNNQFRILQDRTRSVLTSKVTGIAYGSNGIVFMADSKGIFKVYSREVGSSKIYDKLLYESKFVDFSISNLYYVQKTNEVIITGLDKEYYFTFDVKSEKITKRPLRVGKNYLKKSAISEDYFSISDSTGRIMMISTASKTIVNEVRMPSSEITTMRFSSNGKILFISSEGYIFCFSVESMSMVHKFKDYGNFGLNSITTITCSPNGNYLVTGSQSGIINSYRFSDCLEQATPKPLKTIDSIVYPITSLEFSPNSSILLAASEFDKVSSKLILYPSHQTFKNFKPTCKVESFCFSENSQRLVIGEEDGCLTLLRFKPIVINNNPNHYNNKNNKNNNKNKNNKNKNNNNNNNNKNKNKNKK